MNNCYNCNNTHCPLFGRSDIDMILKCPDKIRRPETRDEKIKRLLESHNHLYWSMIKYGCYCKAHDELFKKIKEQLDGIEPEELRSGKQENK